MQRLLLLASLLLMLPAAAQANKTQFTMTTICAVLAPCQPPARYASGPYLAKPSIRLITLRQIQSACGDPQTAASGEEGILGCAAFQGGACIVHVPSDLKAELPEVYRVVLAHELAHCRGWVHAHY